MTTNSTTRNRAKQDWTIGEVVKIGFVAGLEMIRRNPTPGDGRPDVWVLWQAATNRFYSFQPHFGLVRHASLSEALAAV